MTTHTLSGVIPPVVTPLTWDRRLDVGSFESVIERLVAAQVDGLFVLGSTGEVAFADDELRRQVVSEAVRIANGRLPVIAGVVDMQTARVLQHTRAAVDLGASAVVATAPFYAVTPPGNVRRHFEVLGERAGVPVYAYDLPVAVHTKLDPDLLVDLGRDGVIAGVKDSSGDDIGFRRLCLKNAAAGKPLTVLTGHEFVVDGAYLSGADGVVPGLGNVDPSGYVRLHRLHTAGDWEAVRAEQDRLASLMEMCLVARHAAGWAAGVGAFKTALMLLGVIATNQLPEPFEAFTATDVAAVKAVLDAHGPRD